MKVLWEDPIGVKTLWVALGMMISGVFWMRKIIRIHV